MVAGLNSVLIPDTEASPHDPLKGILTVPALFDTNSYFVVGDQAYCTDVLGTAQIAYALALGGSENPAARTDTLLTREERDKGNLIIVGGPAVNPTATEFDGYFGISYYLEYNGSFEIRCERNSIYLDLENYPYEDICIIYLGKLSSRNVLLVWGYGWRGTLAGSMFMGDPANWQEYSDAHMIMLRWKDYDRDGLVETEEITVERYI